MPTQDAFLRRKEALEFIDTVENPTERLLLHAILSNAISFLIFDEEYTREHVNHPMDLLTFIRASKSVLSKRALLQGILDGSITRWEDFDPLTSSLP